VGAVEQTAKQVVKCLNPYGLHFVFLDPFNLQALPFSVIEAFARLERVDMLIHVSAQDLQRNLGRYIQPGDSRLDNFAPGWRQAVSLNQSQRAIRAAILSHWASKITALGLPPSTSKAAQLVWFLIGIDRRPGVVGTGNRTDKEPETLLVGFCRPT